MIALMAFVFGCTKAVRVEPWTGETDLGPGTYRVTLDSGEIHNVESIVVRDSVAVLRYSTDTSYAEHQDSLAVSVNAIEKVEKLQGNVWGVVLLASFVTIIVLVIWIGVTMGNDPLFST